MTVREYNQIIGYETDSAVTTEHTPTTNNDYATLGYSSDNYNVIGEIATLTLLRAYYGETGKMVFVDEVNSFYIFNEASTTADEDFFVIQPSVGDGRWHCVFGDQQTHSTLYNTVEQGLST